MTARALTREVGLREIGLLGVGLLGVVLLAASALHAQWINNGASTAAEGYARGVASITRARSQASVDYAQARIGRSDARSRELDNRLKTTQTFYEMRRISREAKYGTPQEKYDKKRRNEARFAARTRKDDPNVLSDKQLDPLTGEISWPVVLMSPEYEEYRAKIDNLFKARARHGGKISYQTLGEMSKTRDELIDVLKADIPTLGGKKYMTGKIFVKALARQMENSSG